MVKLSQDQFLSKLSKFYNQTKNKGSVYVSIKRNFVGEGKDKYKNNRKQRQLRHQQFKKEVESNVDQAYPIIFKTKCGDKSGSTTAQDQGVYKFANQLINVFRLNMNVDKEIVAKKKIKKLATQKSQNSKRSAKKLNQNKRNQERKKKRNEINKELKKSRQRAAAGKVQQNQQQQQTKEEMEEEKEEKK